MHVDLCAHVYSESGNFPASNLFPCYQCSLLWVYNMSCSIQRRASGVAWAASWVCGGGSSWSHNSAVNMHSETTKGDFKGLDVMISFLLTVYYWTWWALSMLSHKEAEPWTLYQTEQKPENWKSKGDSAKIRPELITSLTRNPDLLWIL